ncbi:MAG: hypothetical protein IKH28_07705 [Lachnospiraceae bacterium]|nr:hypothetical protein [Lachnospiraceae bacterium]
MKKPVVDYTKLRPSNILSPEYRHLLWLLGWVWYLAMYFLTENLIPPEKCHVVHSFMDDVIPFNEYFLIFYGSWYFLIVGTLLYFLLYDPKSLVQIQKFLILTQVIGVAVYLIWPSVQYLRPTEFPRENVFTALLGIIYGVDTPTGVCPSLHCGFAIAILSTWHKKKDANRWWKIALVPWTLLICISVCFVKQHSFVDVWTAFLMCALIEGILYREYWWDKFTGLVRKGEKTSVEGCEAAMEIDAAPVRMEGKEGTI